LPDADHGQTGTTSGQAHEPRRLPHMCGSNRKDQRLGSRADIPGSSLSSGGRNVVGPGGDFVVEGVCLQAAGGNLVGIAMVEYGPAGLSLSPEPGRSTAIQLKCSV
jgi:hypothetical protein